MAFKIRILQSSGALLILEVNTYQGDIKINFYGQSISDHVEIKERMRKNGAQIFWSYA